MKEEDTTWPLLPHYSTSALSPLSRPLHATGASIKGAPTTYLLLLVSSQSLRSSGPKHPHPRTHPSAPYSGPCLGSGPNQVGKGSSHTIRYEPDKPLQQGS